jgi:hypothetical protein
VSDLHALERLQLEALRVLMPEMGDSEGDEYLDFLPKLVALARERGHDGRLSLPSRPWEDQINQQREVEGMSFRDRSIVIRFPALAALVALALLVLVGGSTADATLSDGDVVLGAVASTGCTPGSEVNCATDLTRIVNKTSGFDAFAARAFGSGTGVSGNSDSASGVRGQSGSGDGVFGSSGSGYGVHASSDTNYALFARGSTTGARIETGSQFGASAEVDINNTSNGRGALEASTNGTAAGAAVHGVATSGSGVQGFSTAGNGVRGVALSASATALKAEGKSTFSGKTTFSRSGTVTVAAGTSQKTKSPISLTSASLVLATIQGNQTGVYVQGVTKVTGSSGSFTIHLNKNTTVNLPVAWFVVN